MNIQAELNSQLTGSQPRLGPRAGRTARGDRDVRVLAREVHRPAGPEAESRPRGKTRERRSTL